MTTTTTVLLTTTLTPIPGRTSNVSFSARMGDTSSTVDFFSHWESLIFLVWIPITYAAARFVYSIPYRVRDCSFSLREELTTKDNKACGVSFAGMLIAVGLVLQGAFSDPVADPGTNIYTAFAWTAIGLVYLILSQLLNDLLLHRRVNYQDEIMKQNLAVGVLNGAFFIASGIIARFTIAGKVVDWGEAIASSAILWAMTQIFFIAFVQVYDLITVGVDEQEELLKANLAVGVSVGMSVVACAVQLSSPVEKSESIVAVCIWFGLSLIILLIFKLLARAVFAPNALVEVDGKPSNPSVSSVEGATLLFVALGLRALITYRGCAMDSRPWTTRIIDVPFALSIFTYYNIAFPFLVFVYLLVNRGVFSIPHIIRKVRAGVGFVEAIQSYLDLSSNAYVDQVELRPATVPMPNDPSASAAPAPNNQPTAASAPEVTPASGGAGSEAGGGDVRRTDTNYGFSGGRFYSSGRAISFAGFLIGGGFVLRGALAATVDSLADPGLTLGYFCLWLIFGTALLVINNFLIVVSLWRRIAYQQDNVSGAIIGAAAYITSGLNVGATLMSLQGSETHSAGQEFDWGSDLAVILIYALLQQIVMIIFGYVFQIITPYDDVDEVERKNYAAAWSSALSWIAFGVITSSPIQRNDGAALFFCYCLLAYVYLLLHRVFVDKVILIGAPLADEIVRDRNYGAAMIEGACAIGVAMALASLIRAPCN